LVGNVAYTELNGYYNMADIFVLPSVRDKAGNLDDQSVAVIDAMSCSKPVITSNFKGYQAVISSGVDGFLVGPMKPGQLSEKIIQLIKNKSLRLRVGKQARTKILTDLSWLTIGKRYSRLFSYVTSDNYSFGVPKILENQRRLEVARQIWGVVKHEVTDPQQLKCLDVGASSGVIANHLAKYFKSVEAVDIDANALMLAKTTFKRNNLNFTLLDAEELPYPDNSFDVVVCNQVYNFVKHPQRLMSEIYRILKPGGICFFGARNKLALIEPQYNLPLLSFFPKLLPHGKLYMTYWQLRELTKAFDVSDYTLKILKDPERYNFDKLVKFKNISQFIPEIVTPLIPNFIWVLRKTIQ